MSTSPPPPPSPPSGPPIGTRYSRLNDVHPEPPVPASTWTTTRSMNIVGSAHACEKQLVRSEPVGWKMISQAVERALDFFPRRTRVECAVQMRVKLTLLRRGGACSHDAQLASLEVETRP